MKIETIRHSLSHIMALAVKKLYIDVKFGIGPAIENGFYYDFAFPQPISNYDLPKIEKEMKELIRKNLVFEKKFVNKKEGKKPFKNQPYKLELLEELPDKEASAYKSGDFIDLCKGPHVKSTKEIEPDSFKLTKVAGAYWRGDEKKPMLTRIYGAAFATKKELEEHFKALEKAEKSDHRKIGKDFDLFSFHEEGPGFPFWHPKGMILRESLMKFYNQLVSEAGYQLVSTPILLSEELWRQSGHWDNYKDVMYFTKIDERVFAIKPMNCPGAILIYKTKPRSYKEFPLKYAEAGEVHRPEP